MPACPHDVTCRGLGIINMRGKSLLFLGLLLRRYCATESKRFFCIGMQSLCFLCLNERTNSYTKRSCFGYTWRHFHFYLQLKIQIFSSFSKFALTINKSRKKVLIKPLMKLCLIRIVARNGVPLT